MDNWDFDRPKRGPIYGADDVLALVRPFVAGEINAPDFSDRYMDLFKDTRIENQRVFNILDQLFVDVDDYYDDPAKTPAERAADAKQLLTYAREALARVDKIIAPFEQDDAGG